MITVLEAIKLSTEYLDKKGVELPRANAEILLAEILKCKRLELYLSFEKPLNEKELNQYREFIRQRGSRIPLQYITGHVEFFGMEFIVNHNVLIPRPETELLVEKIILENNKSTEFRILDIGIGSGNISVVLAKHLPNARVTGIDISESAINTAKQNAGLNLITDNLEIIRFDIFNDDLSQLNKYDIIVSNPPYISQEDYKELEPELKFHEPRIALTDGNNGFTFYKKIINSAAQLLYPGGKIYFEVGKDQHAKIFKILLENNFRNVHFLKDYSGIERIIYGELE